MAYFRKRGKVWEYRISYKDRAGKSRIKSKGGFSTKKEATNASLEEEMKLNRKIFEDKSLIFSDFFKKWAEIYKEPIVTVVTYKKILMFSKQVERFFGDAKVVDISPTYYQELLNDYGKKYSQETITQFHHYVKASMKIAVREKLVDQNFAEYATAKSKVKSRPIEESFLEEDEFLKLIEQSKAKYQIKSHMAIYLICVSGMRFAECIGLTWKDVDFDKGSLNINKTWNYSITHNFAETKNKSSIRIIPIDSETVNVLKKFKKEQPKDKFNRIFGNITHTAVSKALKRAVGRNIHIHSLRHTYASYLISQGIDLISISKILGHENLNITLSVYAHQLDKLKQKNDDRVKDVFNKINS